ncbi:MAG: DUF3047 domain-containing protein [Syntrophales bacterium]
MKRKTRYLVYLPIMLLVTWMLAKVLPAAQDIIPVAKFTSAKMHKGLPAGWELDKKCGTPFISLDKAGDSYCLHLFSDNHSSFGIKKALSVDIRQYPYLIWDWAVTRLPTNGDVRNADRDDQAVQIYIAFPATGWPKKLNTPILGYVWDNEAPKNWMGRSRQSGGGKLRYIVLRNSADKLNQWHPEKRNVYEDYKRLFADINNGEPTGPIQGVELYINSQHTGSTAESFICDMYFSRN